MPPSPFGFIALAALMPLFISLRKAASIAEAVRIGLTFALIFNLLSLYFIAFNSGTTVLLGISSYIGLTLIISIFGIISLFRSTCCSEGSEIMVIYQFPSSGPQWNIFVL